jgi:hypothetical protein
MMLTRNYIECQCGWRAGEFLNSLEDREYQGRRPEKKPLERISVDRRTGLSVTRNGNG